MTDTKSLFASKTFWGVAISLLAVFAPKLGFSLGEDTIAGLTDEVVALAGAALAIYGRIAAVKTIK